MTHQLTIHLTETEMQLLKKQAALDCRRPQEQARYMLRSVLLSISDTSAAEKPEQAERQEQ